MTGHILLVEDDENLGFVIKDNLEAKGYEVSWAKNGSDGKSRFGKFSFDLCILDVMLPEMDGFTLAHHIRSSDEMIPILFLTAKSMEEDRLKGFEIGGDDYITKPFSIKELIMRIGVFMRRSPLPPLAESPPSSYGVITIGSYQFDTNNLLLSSKGQTLVLTKMESDLLKYLWEGKNSLVQRSDILVRIWGEDDYFKGRSLDVFISRLRKYLRNDPEIEIRNHHGVGFLLKC